MRIAVFTGSFPQEPFIVEKMMRLSERGLQIDLYCRESGDKKADDESAARIGSHVNVTFLTVWGWRRIWSKLPALAWALFTNLLGRPARTKRCLSYVKRRYGLRRASIDLTLDLLQFLRIDADVLHYEWDFTAAKNLDFLHKKN